MSHDELVLTAAEWVQNRTHRCKVVAIERLSQAPCIPDVLGWDCHGSSVLVECKTSRSDFLADQRKPHRANDWMCVGNKRYYMTPPDLLDTDDLPDGWGLVEAFGGVVRCIRGSQHFRLGDQARDYERKLLVAQCRSAERGHVNINGEPLIGHPEYEVSQ